MKRLLISLLAALALPTAANANWSIFVLKPVYADSLFYEKVKVAATVGGILCFSKKGLVPDFNELLNETIKNNGYNPDHLSDNNVFRLGELIAEKLGNRCTDQNLQRILLDEKFKNTVMQFLL